MHLIMQTIPVNLNTMSGERYQKDTTIQNTSSPCENKVQNWCESYVMALTVAEINQGEHLWDIMEQLSTTSWWWRHQVSLRRRVMTPFWRFVVAQQLSETHSGHMLDFASFHHRKLIKTTLKSEKLHLWAEIINRYYLTWTNSRVVLVPYKQLQSGIIQCSTCTVHYTESKAWCKCLGGGDSSGPTHTHTQTHTHSAWYFLALPVSSIRLITHKKSRANVWSTPHTAAAQHQEQRDTSVHIKTRKQKKTKQKPNNKYIKAAHSCPFQIEHRQDRQSRAPDCDLLASSRDSQGHARFCCQIQQLNSVHDDADWRKCLGFLCKHWGSLKHCAHLGLFS